MEREGCVNLPPPPNHRQHSPTKTNSVTRLVSSKPSRNPLCPPPPHPAWLPLPASLRTLFRRVHGAAHRVRCKNDYARAGFDERCGNDRQVIPLWQAHRCGSNLGPRIEAGSVSQLVCTCWVHALNTAHALAYVDPCAWRLRTHIVKACACLHGLARLPSRARPACIRQIRGGARRFVNARTRVFTMRGNRLLAWASKVFGRFSIGLAKMFVPSHGCTAIPLALRDDSPLALRDDSPLSEDVCA